MARQQRSTAALYPKSIPLHWQVGEGVEPETWIDAAVPGAVQLDIARARGWGPHYYAENWRDYLWMEDRTWTYRARFNRPPVESNERLLFVSKGIDYRYAITCNGVTILKREGMFKPIACNISALLKARNELIVTVFPAAKVRGRPMDKSQAAESFRPAVSYGWDCHPRLIPLGIWDETGLELRGASHLHDVELGYSLDKNLGSARLRLAVRGQALAGRSFQWTVRDSRDRLIWCEKGPATADSFTLRGLADDVKLWWPRGHGESALYSWRFELKDGGRILERRSGRTGFRRIRLVMNEGAWERPRNFPKSRSDPPMTLEINGRRIFAIGSNWISPEIFPGKITTALYQRLLRRACQANFNLLRVWGGGMVNKCSFYDLCDRMGLMIWQEFPLACNCYPDKAGYLRVLKSEAVAIVRRLRRHACLALWCGGNELFNAWSGMTDQSLALRTLNSICLRHDPQTPFIPTSPVMGVGHGHYLFCDEGGRDVMQRMIKSRCSAYTEFGVPSPAGMQVLRKILPGRDLYPPRPGTAWESHGAFNAWLGESWLELGTIERYFGPSAGLEELVERGQFLQSEGIRFFFEEARRQKPACSMALNWCFNEAWPTAANNSLITWPDLPKPSLRAAARACRPAMASARFARIDWAPGTLFQCQLWMLNDRLEAVESGTMQVYIRCGSRRRRIGRWEFPKLAPGIHIRGPKLEIRLPEQIPPRFKLQLCVDQQPRLDSEYVLLKSAS